MAYRNRFLYENSTLGTLAFDGKAVAFGTVRMKEWSVTLTVTVLNTVCTKRNEPAIFERQCMQALSRRQKLEYIFTGILLRILQFAFFIFASLSRTVAVVVTVRVKRAIFVAVQVCERVVQ